MSQNIFTLVAGLVFFVVAGLHALRLLLGWEAVIGGWDVPRWVSVAGLLIAGYLSYAAFALMMRKT